jgi:putative acyl-CoA dehydrogenase
MLQYAPRDAADAFIGARLGDDRAAQYGVLPVGMDPRPILRRHEAPHGG